MTAEEFFNTGFSQRVPPTLPVESKSARLRRFAREDQARRLAIHNSIHDHIKRTGAKAATVQRARNHERHIYRG